jgi:hypothetical protein
MVKKKNKIVVYEQAPFVQGYCLALSDEKFYNPYNEVEDAEADALDFHRGFENGVGVE